VLALIAVVAAAILFGTTGTAQALGPADTTPLAVGAVRLAVGGTALGLVGLVWGARVRRRTPDAPAWTGASLGYLVLTGVCLAAYQPLFFLGTARNGVAVGTVIALGSAPVIAGLLEWALTRRPPSVVWLGATGMALAGVALLAIGGGGAGASGADPVGLVGSIGAGASFAVLANAQRRLLQRGWDPFSVAGAMGAVSAAISFAVLPFVGLAWLTEPRGGAIALWLGLTTILVAYGLFTWAMQRLTAATAATLTLAEPLTASILGIAVLGERLEPLAIVGLVVLGAGLLLLAGGARRPRDPRPFAVEG
jgi:drug/metabolite transporter, DME family